VALALSGDRATAFGAAGDLGALSMNVAR